MPVPFMPKVINEDGWLEMAALIEQEFPELFKQYEQMIKEGNTGMDLVNRIRDVTKLDLKGAVTYRTALVKCLL